MFSLSNFCLFVVLATSSSVRLALARPSSFVTRTSENSTLSSLDDPYRSLPQHDDLFAISQRDVAIDSNDLSLLDPTKESIIKRRPANRKFLLRSSFHNVTGINGYTVSTLPIFAHDLSNLLSSTRSHLQNTPPAPTPFFQFNTSTWSFTILTSPAHALPRATILTILTRFQTLAKSSSPTDSITTTLVAVLLNDTSTTPIADVLILPISPSDLKTNYTPFNLPPPSSPVPTPEIFQITPYGLTCALSSPNSSTTTALTTLTQKPDPSDSLSVENPLRLHRRADPTNAILARIGQSAFHLSIRVCENAVEGHPVQVPRWMVVGMARLALAHVLIESVGGIATGVVDGLSNGAGGMIANGILATGGIIGGVMIDTGFFALGRMVGRLVMQSTRQDARGRAVRLGWETWAVVVGGLGDVLQRGGDGGGAVGWAYEGNILVPRAGVGAAVASSASAGAGEGLIVVGRWQLWVGDSGLRIEDGGG